MQDGTQEGNETYVISHRGARSRGYKRREGARARASEGERERVPARLPVCPRRPTCILDVQRCPCCNVCPRRAFGRPWTSPFIDARRCLAVQGV
jgi:hypothetical protein